MLISMHPRSRRTTRPVRLTDNEAGLLTADLPGERLEDVADVVIQLAETLGRPRRLEFNGVILEISGSDSVESVLERFHAELSRRAEAYRNSPAGKRAAEERAVEVAGKQLRVVELSLALLLLRPGNHEGALRWARALADVADDVAVSIDHDDLTQNIEILGYRANENTATGMGPADCFKLQEKLRSDSEAMARYIMGQVLDCLKRKMPPHPIVIQFVDEWLVR